MKTCPDCAESVQDAARKCRYCGYRFDGLPNASSSAETAPVLTPSDPASESVNVGTSTPAAPASSSGWPFLIVASGGALVSIGGLALCVLFATGPASPLLTTGAFALGGILLATGWALLLSRPEVGIGSVIGSLALSAGWIGGACIDLDGGPLEQMVKGMLGTAGLFVCGLMHLNTLERLGLDGARIAALVAVVGFGIELAAITKKIPLPEPVQTGLMWIGVIGTVLFGIVLVLGAGSRWVNSKSR